MTEALDYRVLAFSLTPGNNSRPVVTGVFTNTLHTHINGIIYNNFIVKYFSIPCFFFIGLRVGSLHNK